MDGKTANQIQLVLQDSIAVSRVKKQGWGDTGTANIQETYSKQVSPFQKSEF